MKEPVFGNELWKGFAPQTSIRFKSVGELETFVKQKYQGPGWYFWDEGGTLGLVIAVDPSGKDRTEEREYRVLVWVDLLGIDPIWSYGTVSQLPIFGTPKGGF